MRISYVVYRISQKANYNMRSTICDIRTTKIMYPESKIDLSVDFCGIRFENPFILAAAPPTDELDMVRDAFAAGWAGAVLKTTAMPGTPVDLVYPLIAGIDYEGTRAVGLTNIDLISYYHVDIIEERVKLLKTEFPSKIVIASITGQTKDDWTALVERLENAGCDMIEASFSCPQGTLGLPPGAMLAQDAVAAAQVTSWIKSAAKRCPIVIKLTPLVNDIAAVAKAVCDAGADAVCVGNTVPSLTGIDLETGIPYPQVGDKSTYSGLSGPMIRPISLGCIAKVAKAGIAISGSGGATTWRDALEFMLLGASVVQFGTAVMHYGSDIITDLIEGVRNHLKRKGITAIREVIGQSLQNIVSHEELERGVKVRASIDHEKCIRDDLCMLACRDGGHRAITVDAERNPIVDEEKCVGCGLCCAICPVTDCIKLMKR